MFADRMIAFDHKENSVYLVYSGLRDEARQADAWFDEMELRFESGFPQPAAAIPAEVDMEFHAEQTHERYLESVGECLEFIRDGESYEICLTNSIMSAQLLSRPPSIQPGSQLRVPPLSGCFRRVFFTGTLPEN
jgi:para-aminobenzoate synthetase